MTRALFLPLVAGLLATLATLAGCAPVRPAASTGEHVHGGPGQTGMHAQGGPGQAAHHAAGDGSGLAMCRHYDEMSAAHDPAARQAMMERHMPQLSAEQRARQMAMMQERCPRHGAVRDAP